MADTPPEERPDRSEENAKLELPSLSLPRFGRRKKRQEPVSAPPTPRRPEPVTPAREAPPAPSTPPVSVEVAEQPRREPRVMPSRPSSPSRLSMPSLPPRLAVAVTGLLVGIVGVALTYVGLQGCDAVRGTATCGGGPGLLLLVVILAVMVLLGAACLRLLGIGEAGGTSFLAVGVVVVVCLLALQGVLQSAVMALVLPVLCVLAYLLAHLVTTAFVEPRPEKGPQHDVR